MLYKFILKNGSKVFAEMSEDAKDNIVKYLDGIKDYTLLEDITIFTIEKKAVKYKEIFSVEEVENPIDNMLFELKPEHIKALKRLNIKSFVENIDSVNICLDTKRTFGNSDVFGDIFEFLDFDIYSLFESDDFNEDNLISVYEKAMMFLAELPIAYKVIMDYETFNTGVYHLSSDDKYGVLFYYNIVKNFVALRRSIKEFEELKTVFDNYFKTTFDMLEKELFNITVSTDKPFSYAFDVISNFYRKKTYLVYSFAKILKIFNNNAPDNQKISITKDMIMNALKKNHIEILCNCGSKKVSLKIKKEIIEFKNYDWENILLLDQYDKEKLSDIVYKNVCELLEIDPVSYYRMYLLLN